MTHPRRRRLAFFVAVAVIVLGAGACRVRTDVGVQVNDDGSGTVTIAVTLDPDAVANAPDIASALKVDDLTRTGWTVTQDRQPDGSLVFKAVKPFATPEEAGRIFTEVSGEQGPFRDFRITRSRSFARTTTEFSGTVDFSHGLESFGDSDLTQTLGGQPLGEDINSIQQRIGDTLDNVFQFRVVVRLPGDIESNAPGRADNGAEWQPKLSDHASAQLVATGRSWRVGSIVAVSVAVVAFMLLVSLLVFRLAVRSAARRAHR